LSTDQRLPISTLALIAANLAAAFSLIWQPDLVKDYGFNPADPTVLTAFTSMFLHLNLLHLLGNMVFLAAVGPAVEWAAGAARFLSVYFLGGLAGVAVHWAFADKTGNPPPLIGASGCISALIAYYAFRYYHVRVSIAPRVTTPMYAIIAIWVLLQIAGAFVGLGSAQPGTAYWAHLGGFAMGIVLSIAFSALGQGFREKSYEMIDEMDRRSPAAKLAAADAALRHHPKDANALRQKAEALSRLNETDEEAACLLELLDVADDQDQKEVLARLDKINRLERLPSLRRTLLAERYKTTEPDLSRLLLLSVIRVMNDKQRPDALLALATLDYDNYPENAKTWLRDLFTHYPMHPATDLARTRGWSP